MLYIFVPYTCHSFYVNLFHERQRIEFPCMSLPWVWLISACLPYFLTLAPYTVTNASLGSPDVMLCVACWDLEINIYILQSYGVVHWSGNHCLWGTYFIVLCINRYVLSVFFIHLIYNASRYSFYISITFFLFSSFWSPCVSPLPLRQKIYSKFFEFDYIMNLKLMP